MAFSFIDRASQITSTLGTGSPLLLDGPAVNPYQTWAVAGAIDGNSYDYVILDPFSPDGGANAWEICTGVYSAAGPSITRVTVSSNLGVGIPITLSGVAYLSQEACANTLNTFSAGAGGVYPSLTPPPAVGTWTWVNQGGATATTNADGSIYIRAPASAGDNMRILVKPLPPTPYVIRALVIPNLQMIDFCIFGLCWRESSTGRLITNSCVQGNTFITDMFIGCQDFTNPTTFNAQNVNINVGFAGGTPVYLECADDGVNRKMSWCVDGYNYELGFSEARTTFMTADQIGFYANRTANSTFAAGTLKGITGL